MQVTIVGGGSYQWTPELLADLMGTPSLKEAKLVLEDINPVPLEKTEALGLKLQKEMKSSCTISSTTEQERALDGADFVIVCISTGGFESMGIDLEVSAKHGIRHSVGDTVGPGGINRALRNIPVLVGIAKDMEKYCPDAWLLNITNPMTTLTRAVSRETSIRAVGLCHEVWNFRVDLAMALGRRWEDIRPTIAGINHFPVITALDIDGEDGFSILTDLVCEAGGLETLTPFTGGPEPEPFSILSFIQRNLLKLTLLEHLGAFPAAGDRHIAEFLSSILTPESNWGMDYNIELTSIAERKHHEEGFRSDVDGWLAGTKELQTWQSGELPSPLIEALLGGNPIEAPVNIPNVGQVPCLPKDVVVEAMCVVDSNGIHGKDEPEIPAFYAEMLRRHSVVQEITVEAALSGDVALVDQAFELDPLAGRGDFSETRAMVRELLSGTSRWLPQFSLR